MLVIFLIIQVFWPLNACGFFAAEGNRCRGVVADFREAVLLVLSASGFSSVDLCVKMNKINNRPCSDREKERFRQLEVAKELKRQQKDQRKEQKRNEREAAMELERIRKKKEKDLKKQQDEADKEQKRKEKESVELQKEQKRKEREAIEAEREQKRKEKDLKRQQEEAEKEQKKKEKEAAERKKQLVIQKQATIMDKLFRRKEPETPAQQTQGAEEMHKGQQSLSPLEQSITGSNTFSNPAATHMITAQMDQELTAIQSRSVEELLRSHITAWQGLKKVTALEKPQRWGLRRKPKVSIYRELRLQGAAATTSQMTDSGASHSNCDGITSEKTTLPASIKRLREAPRDEEPKVEVNGEDQNCMVIEDPDELPRKELCSKQWKLLQFDKSYRPAYYGTFSKTSTTIGPRHPLKRDPSLNYEVDSDEEWEEEDPGESLSDCEDKEDDMEKLDNEVDEDAADGFVVPDGYLSDSEGVHLDDANNSIDGNNLETSTPELSCRSQEEVSCSTTTAIDEEVQKHKCLTKLLDNMTKQALLRNQPFIISTLTPQSGAEHHHHSPIHLQCLQALKMQVVEPYMIIRSPTAVEIQEKSEMETKSRKTSKTKDLKRRRIQLSSVTSTSSATVTIVV